MNEIHRPSAMRPSQGETASISRPNIAVGAIATEMRLIGPRPMPMRVQRVLRSQDETVSAISPSYGR